jgi:hypothetical protein
MIIIIVIPSAVKTVIDVKTVADKNNYFQMSLPYLTTDLLAQLNEKDSIIILLQKQI